MKKFLIILILIIFSLPVYAQNTGMVEDELLKSNYFKGNSTGFVLKEQDPIKDELLEIPLYKDSVFRLGVSASGEYTEIPVEDELIDDGFIENAKNFVIVSKEHPDEYFIEKKIDLTKVRIIKPKTKYDFTKKIVPIKIKIAKHLKSAKKIKEGSTISFIAQNDFEIKGKKYEKGTTILGRVEIISASDKMGVPETLKISNFFIEDDNEEINLYGAVSKTGANRSIWVYPLYQAGNILFYAAGFAVVPIHGGRAKVLTSESFTVFYETQ